MGIEVHSDTQGYGVFGMLNNWHFKRFPDHWEGTGPKVPDTKFWNKVEFYSSSGMIEFLNKLKSTTFKQEK